MVRTEKRLRLCLTLIVCGVLFIWGNSLLPGHISGAISDFIWKLISFGKEASAHRTGTGILRKLGHFTEFACLGALFAWLYSMLKRPRVFALLCGFAVACVDETIQCFVPGRGPRFTDVLLDSAGAACGIALLLLGLTIYQKKKNKSFGGYEQ